MRYARGWCKNSAVPSEWKVRESLGCQCIDDRIGFFELVVANAQHIKAVPGRKTDVQDADWIADLLQHGLLTASFVPSQEQP